MKTLTIPAYLKEGDTVAIISPSGVVDRDVILKAVVILKTSGFSSMKKNQPCQLFVRYRIRRVSKKRLLRPGHP
jgi:muramoyltetrapeptide carboxypeptidase LdcA involved in peptidoglycan recycling